MRTKCQVIAWIHMLGACSVVLAMSGRAAVVNHLELSPFYGPQPANRSKLMVVTVDNNSVTATDTILKTGGRFYYPTWSFDGSRIAFYRDGGGVSIVDADGQNLRTVANTPNWGSEDLEQNICWPAVDGGRWVFYHRPCESGCFRGGSGEIWRVNVDDTTQKSLVCDYKYTDNQLPEGWGLWFNDFMLSADASYCVIMTTDWGQRELSPWSGGIIPHTFPPEFDESMGCVNPHLTRPSCGGQECYYQGDCNAAISASGKVMYHFRGGHCQLYAHYWDHDANTIGDFWTIGSGGSGSLDQYTDVQQWLAPGSPDVGATFIQPRGSSNSDQIVTILCAYQYSAGYGSAGCGANMVVANWKDKEAVMATNNPEPPHPNGYVTEGNYYRYADPGDFWLSGGPAGSYEAIDGSWVEVDGATASYRGTSGGRSVPPAPGKEVSGALKVYNLKGVRVEAYHSGLNGYRIPRGAFVAVDALNSRARRVVGLDNR